MARLLAGAAIGVRTATSRSPVNHLARSRGPLDNDSDFRHGAISWPGLATRYALTAISAYANSWARMDTMGLPSPVPIGLSG